MRYAAPVPVASVQGGYYDEAFLLKLSAPANGTIYYTTDGSTPTIDSHVYTDGILIQNRTQEPNKYNAIQNVMTNWLEYTPTSAPVAKGTVVRAIYVNDLGITSSIFTQTYFVGIPCPRRGYTLSLVFEDEDLFGSDGICVTGSEYDSWYLSGINSIPAPEPNFNKKTEVSVIAELMDANGDIMNCPVLLRLQGASMRGWIQKRFILEADSSKTGSNVFPIELFSGTSTHSVMTKGSVVDAMVHDLVAGRSAATQQSIPVSLYLNGEFWYSWYFLERYDNQYFRQHYNVDNVYFVKDGEIDEDVPPEEADAYEEMMYWLAHTDFSVSDNWAQLNKEIDVQSYIDYLTVNYYLCNWDFSDYKNHALWRSIYEEPSPFGDKRWRWCLYDVDAVELTTNKYAVENAAEVNIFSDPLPYSDVKVNETVYFRAMRQNPEFCRQFVLSFMDIINNHFSTDALVPVLEKYGLSLDWMDGFFLKRPGYAAQHLADEFQLTGKPEPVTITTAHPEMGNITVNTSEIDLSNGIWTGNYFTDYPITVTASANDGYQFLGWKGAADESGNTLTIHTDGGILLEAVFAEIK